MAEGISRPPLALVAPATAAAAFALGVVASALVDVRQQRQLTGALDRTSDLALMAPAGTCDPPGADLALLGDELAQRGRVLVVGLLDLLLAIRARLAPAAAGPALLVTSARGLATVALLSHYGEPFVSLPKAHARACAAVHCDTAATQPRGAAHAGVAAATRAGRPRNAIERTEPRGPDALAAR